MPFPGEKELTLGAPSHKGKKALIFRGFEDLLFLRMLPVFPCPQLLAPALAHFGTGRTVKAVGPSGRKQLSALPAAQRLAPLH